MSLRAPFAFAWGALVAALACGSPSKPPPVADVREVLSRPMSPEVEIPVEIEGDRVATAWVTTGGAFKSKRSGREVVHVRLSLRNLEARPLRLPLDLITLEGLGERPLRPLTMLGHDANRASITVDPGEARVVELLFPVPMTMTLEEVKRFRLRWGVDDPRGIVRTETEIAY